jgi:MMP 1-O-methyltransferase
MLPVAKAAIDWVVDMSVTVPGWRMGEESMALATVAYELPAYPTIVEVGVFMGRGTILLAGSRRLRGNGSVHSVDPFDCSGDAYSTPHYERLLNEYGVPSLEDVFRIHLKRFALENVVEVQKGTSAQIAADWRQPIDLLLLDGDQSPQGAKEAFESWVRFVKPGGTVVLGNSGERDYAPTHDGNYLLAKERFRPPEFSNIRCVMYATFASKV